MFFFTSRKNLGFSLLEVLASILLLASLVSIIMQLSYGNMRRAKKSRQLEKIASLLEQKMMQLEEQFKSSNIENLLKEHKGDFPNEKSFFWHYKTQAFNLPSTQLLLNLSKLPADEMNTKMISILHGVLSETIIELKLTVSYQAKKGESFNYSLVSYFINYENAQDFIFQKLQALIPQ